MVHEGRTIGDVITRGSLLNAITAIAAAWTSENVAPGWAAAMPASCAASTAS